MKKDYGTPEEFIQKYKIKWQFFIKLVQLLFETMQKK